MKKLLTASVGLLLLLGPVRGANSESWGSTGDRKLDYTLEQIDREAANDPAGFIRQLSSRLKIEERDIRQAKEEYRLGAADLFMATSLAKATHRPVLSVAEEYRKGQGKGKGWGVLAMDMGIKPGSRAFQTLKKNARGSLAHMDSVTKSELKHEREMQKAHEQKMKKDHDQRTKKASQGRANGTSR